MTEEPDLVAKNDALPQGSRLRAYIIDEVIGRGGFGIVYRARHEELDVTVAIKEYLPTGLAFRHRDQLVAKSVALHEAFDDGLHRFREEARRLVDFQEHPNIVSCRDFFRLNGTAYLVMEYVDGIPLSELMARREAADRPFAEWDLLEVMLPVLQGLNELHRSRVVHRDLKPPNILVRRDGQPVLIDFGAAKQDFAEHTKSAAPLTDGYAALEQVGEGRIGPWTDIYAAGAVMWRMVAAGNPPWSPPHPLKVERRANALIHRQSDPLPSARELGAGRFRPEILHCIDKCLDIEHTSRPQTCRDVVRMLGTSAATGATEGTRSEETDSTRIRRPEIRGNIGAKRPRSIRAWLLGMGVLAAIALLALVTTFSKPEVDALPPVAASIPPAADPASPESDGVSPASDSSSAEPASNAPETTSSSPASVSVSPAAASPTAEPASIPPDHDLISTEPGTDASENNSFPAPATMPTEEPPSILPEPASNSPASVSVPPVAALPPASTPSPSPVAGDRWTNDLGMEFVWVTPGRFRMGSTSAESFPIERPVTNVTISRGFYMGRYEVAQGQWEAVMGSNPSYFKDCGPDCPVENVSWNEVQDFLRRLNAMDAGHEYRLPSEAEWEYAARAGTTSDRYAENVGAVAWYGDNSGGVSHPVGRRTPNRIGLHDMLGNVWEWVQDWYGEYPGGAVMDPAGPSSGLLRVARGGSSGNFARYCRSAYRFRDSPGFRTRLLGFRVVRVR